MIVALNSLDRLVYKFAIGKQEFELKWAGPCLMLEFEFVQGCGVGAHQSHHRYF
jgi:hypothetical protein